MLRCCVFRHNYHSKYRMNQKVFSLKIFQKILDDIDSPKFRLRLSSKVLQTRQRKK